MEERHYQNCELQCGGARIMRWLPTDETIQPGVKLQLAEEVGEWTVNTVYFAQLPEHKLLPEYKKAEVLKCAHA